jgi:exodeoxyribonuclease X
MQNFLAIDLETTAREPADAEVVEFAAVTATLYGDGKFAVMPERNHGLVDPGVPIPPETSALHQIINADVRGSPTWPEALAHIRQLAESVDAVLVAHNTSLERALVADAMPGRRWVCTYKAALRVWPDAPAHTNETLRYFLGPEYQPDLGRGFLQRPHSALHDALVTAHTLGALLGHATIDEMVAWEGEVALLPRCPIGKYRNMKWADVPSDYLEWILYKAVDMREDIRFAAAKELRGRT